MFVGADVNSSEAVTVAVDDDGGLLDRIPDRLAPGGHADLGRRQEEFIERVTQHLSSVEMVVLVDVNLHRVGPSSVRDRAYIEAAMASAACRVGATLKVVHQKSIGSHLDLGPNASKDDIRSAVADIVGEDALSPDPDRRARAIGAVWASRSPTGRSPPCSTPGGCRSRNASRAG